ncbi:5-formyltetrahydrofolate cyclo-ligase [Nocardioides sp. MAH-18]|uniref:5-formyltetrahydrofolate cyclo-ligase n=1 Tax=Nocardioides agri TaxID=2682843 RepID=A0A6L6XV83_9ACTN|nr:5-formyltetrahydrofolate cyclo-ligase [Nocardioides sp. CGMCC 1.13656]MBA2955814.1 5-formyltetrahydrofolate cyclo-ligase [Nocardioides sp. CGMCC 1.13656]MVQ50663.1 5-formyltetrahydrofolate cyclo-ligase [Nocardioides sp. MAH-18]
MAETQPPAKLAARDQLLAARRRRPLVEVVEAARAIAEHLLAAPEVRRAATVAAYVSLAGEPGTGPLLDALRDRGTRVVLPVLQPDHDLDWAVYDGPDSLVGGRWGLLEPRGPRLGVDAISTADVVLVPGLAVDPAGVRLGRGGGSYDRALARVPVGTFTCVLLYDGEVGIPVPVEPHDRTVTHAATPSALVPLGRRL